MARLPTKLLQNLADEFWAMRKKIKQDVINYKNDPDSDNWIVFDYPDYYGLSYKVNSRLSGDFVDTLQGDMFSELEWNGIKGYKKFFRSKRDLHRHLVRMWKYYGN